MIHWHDDAMIWTRSSHDLNGSPSSGEVIAPTAPFKGICQGCKKRANVRHYPWNCEEWLGTFCKHCIDSINRELS